MGAGVGLQAVGRVKQVATHITHKLVALVLGGVALECAGLSKGLVAVVAGPACLILTVGQLVSGWERDIGNNNG